MLYIVATPIGNLEDITLRALRILQESDMLVCEDTRSASILLQKYNIRKPTESFHAQSSHRKISYILGLLKQGKTIAYLCDRGTPGISDPGSLLVAHAVQENIPVVPIPGANACITALSGSGLPTNGFIFLGFLPRKPGKIRKLIEKASTLEKTIVFYESARRIHKTMTIICELPMSFDIVIARELTKKFEEFIRGNSTDIEQKLQQKTIQGEITVLLSPAVPEKQENTY